MSDEYIYYYGKAENRLNAKGQVIMPARFRSNISDEDKLLNYVITRGEGMCLYMYTHRQFAAIKDNAKRFAEESGDIGFFRQFMSEVHAADIDPQGRFVLPQKLRQLAGIDGPEVLFIGMDRRIELWAPSVYDLAMRESEKYEDRRGGVARRIFGI